MLASMCAFCLPYSTAPLGKISQIVCLVYARMIYYLSLNYYRYALARTENKCKITAALLQKLGLTDIKPSIQFCRVAIINHQNQKQNL